LQEGEERNFRFTWTLAKTTIIEVRSHIKKQDIFSKHVWIGKTGAHFIASL